MNKNWLILIEKYGKTGAREKFEDICGTLFKKVNPKKNVRNVEVKQGDGGIDILIGVIGLEPIDVIQCKFFYNYFGDSQKAQIRKSFETAIKSQKYKMAKWTLCVACRLSLAENTWWVNWRSKMIKRHKLTDDFINLIDGDDLIDLLKKHSLYNTSFEKEDSIKIGEIHKKINTEISLNELEHSLKKASAVLSNVKNYFEEDPTTHIKRTETKNIIYWVKNVLEDSKKNVLVLEGDKGLGKSVILKDVYENLIKEDYLVLGIKADKYYAENPKELENQLFMNDKISFSKIIEVVNTNKKQLVIIIDQLDALSQTLSLSRECLQTYNRVVNELVDEENIRVIISSRTYDLKYDAELSTYKSNEYENIKTNLLNEDEVRRTLNKFGISYSIKKFIELLRTPNHLEIFCKLPNKNKIILNALSSLKDLYDELWSTLISTKKDLQLENLLYEIAIEMYQQQQIIVAKNKFVSKFSNELCYLLSNKLLTIEENHIQFFHQTFYDYCFSRQFVENENDIYNYLNQNQQNLEVRSIIKMVFEYLREYDHKKYIKYTKNILNSSKYRFHIKSLIINNLGLVNPSNNEKELIESHILNNKKYEYTFINSVFSEKWIEYLIDYKIADKYLFVKKTCSNSLYDFYKRQSIFNSKLLEKFDLDKIIEYKKNAIWVLFRNNINKAPHKIIDYLNNLSDFENKENFIESMLYSLDNWEDKVMLPYFTKNISFDIELEGRYNFRSYQALEKIFEYHPDYVYCKLKPILINRFNNNDSWFSIEFPHSQNELLNKMYNIHPEDVFIFLFEIYKEVIDKNKRTEFYEKVDSPYYDCTKFYDVLSSSNQGHIFIQEFLLKHLLTKKENKDYILKFYGKLKNSNSIHLLRLIILFFKENIENYINEIFEIISIIHSKNGLNGYDTLFHLYVSQVIGSSYILFSDIQKQQLTDILLSIEYLSDLKSWRYENSDGNKKTQFTGYGKKLYRFLRLIPLNEINNNNKLKTKYLELKRRFGQIDANKAMSHSTSSFYAVGAPLKPSAYQNMNFESWKKSMLKFDDNYIEGHGPKGGKTEHSRAFYDIVKENPDKCYDFILNLFEDKKISKDYLSSGIGGLIEGNFNPNNVKILYKKLINLSLDRTNTLYTIWKADYLIEHQLIDEEIIKFLCENALNHPSPEETLNGNDPLFDSRNTVRGAAIYRIINCYEYKEFSELIFKTIEQATNDPQISVKVAVINQLYLLKHLDVERSFNIFMKLTRQGHLDVLKNSICSSKYYNTRFHYDMISYFEKIISQNELHKYGYLIVWSWLDEKINDRKLFDRFIKKSKVAKLCAIDVAGENLIGKDGKMNSKSILILNNFLNQKDTEFSSRYSSLILREFQSNNFKQLYSFLASYSKTKLCIDEPRGFLMLLLKCVKDYPLECLKLLENMNFKKTPNVQEHYQEEKVQLILAIYSKLNMNLKQNKKHVIKALDIFDHMLIHNHLRSFANNAIELTV